MAPIFVGLVLPILIGWVIGRSRGRPWLGVLLPFFLSWIGVLALLFVIAFKRCPYCRERMSAAATVCPHCTRDV